MKILHLGDLHIGKTLGEFELYEDQKFILDQILEIAQIQKVDAVLIAGDVYDKSVPSEKAVELLDYFIKELAKQHTQTFLISGNHDSDERLNFGSSLFETEGIHIVSKFQGKMKEYTLEDEFGEIHIFLLPFVKASQVRHFYPETEIKSYDDAVRTVIAQSDIDRTKRNILVAHQFVAGVEDPKLAGSEGLIAQSVGLVEKISYSSMLDFDYVALGHIHSPQIVGVERIRYAGSPLKYSLAEALSDKKVPIIMLGEKKGDDYAVQIEEIELKPLRDLRHITGTMKQLLSNANVPAQGKDDFIYATLTDEEIVNDAMSIFQQYYPNTVKIDYDNSHTKALKEVEVADFTKHKSFDELIGEFYEMAYGCEMGDDEREMMRQVAREAGVLYEAN